MNETSKTYCSRKLHLDVFYYRRYSSFLAANTIILLCINYIIIILFCQYIFEIVYNLFTFTLFL
jgi:hypothetical protein